MPTYNDPSEISPIENIALLVSGTPPKFVAATTVHPVMIRVPITDLCFIDAMAKMAGKSRSQMCVMLLNAAVDAVKEKLDDEAHKKMAELLPDIIAALNPTAEVDYEKV